jgi:hypothetical protein
MKYLIASSYLCFATVPIGFCQDLEIDYNFSTNSASLTWDSVPDRSYFWRLIHLDREVFPLLYIEFFLSTSRSRNPLSMTLEGFRVPWMNGISMEDH